MPKVDFHETLPVPLPTPDFAARFLAKDPGLWSGGSPEAVGAFLGWIDVIPKMRERLGEFAEIVAESRAAGDRRIVLAGMGGSSLAPYVLAATAGADLDVDFVVLDSTHPETIRRVVEGSDPATTLVVVSSKSGSTAEPNAFARTFEERVGPGRMIAITDPGSPFQKHAEEKGYRRVVLAYKDIGGRYSALSPFGLVPAALMGLNPAEILDDAEAALAENATDEGPAYRLGALVGANAKDGVDKLTILAAPGWETVGLWLEQLVAESTGKHEKGVFPVAQEMIGAPDDYGRDRFFLAVRPPHEVSDDYARDVRALADAGRPLVTLEGPLGWLWMTTEIMTATAGAVLGIDPFDQPDVESAKIAAREVLKSVEETGELPAPGPGFEHDGVTIYGDDCSETLGEAVIAFLGSTVPGEYVAIHAYLDDAHETRLLGLQTLIRNRTGRATTMGLGPRFLHSTGQFHKGGTNSGLHLQLVDRPSADVTVPGQRATYAQFIAAQAQGDAKALRDKGRRVLTIDLGDSVERGLLRLADEIDRLAQ